MFATQPTTRSFAEREGFEPPEPRSSTVFKTAAIAHSAIFPGTKVARIFHSAKSLSRLFPTEGGKVPIPHYNF